ncbi:rhomboid family intramembrane serine protease [Pedobacter mucosus]|uniref:rhomboid family intramembrane serine protease n=1 Tax=Pedobacter mucosus TaxID=2895286 RepID=UPI001EE4E53D|nr:rhomboid family intramembrane serine protease [Pedobacter mucosus]UKT62951.1 rhomboid family intramembrane serine protease [Pedobacter mucosus]
MNNNIFKEVKQKVFQSSNPLFFYMGVNAILFLFVAITTVFIWLSGNNFDISFCVREYLGLPAEISKLPERFYTVVTYMFFHEGFLHLLFNMIGLYWFGNIFMNFLATKQFHFVYIVGGLMGAFFYVAGLNIFPVFAGGLSGATVIGSSAAVMAIITATATLVPNYAVMMLFIGEVKIKWIAIVYFIISFIGLSSANAGGNFSHIGGAILGFVFIKSLQGGNDWSKIFERKSKLKVVVNDQPIKKSSFKGVSQQEIDAILDKISTSGYDKLSAMEKEKLFKASKD